jgi:peptidoglycan/LPS O-acetylase OafA/YrhL
MPLARAQPAPATTLSVPLGDAPPPAIAPAHLPALDGLRGCAILAVILYHYLAKFGSTLPGLRELLGLVHSGWTGVDLFFVLSGFLITGILHDTRTAPCFFRTFYARRTLRIFPLYYAILATAFLILPHLPPTAALDTLRHHKLALFTYTSNLDMGLHESFFFNAPPLYLGHFWSLALEEQFYLLWPAVIFFLPRKGALAACLALITLAPAARVALALHGHHQIGLYILPFCRADALATGALAALLARTPGKPGLTRLHALQRPAQFTLGLTAIPLLLLFAPARELQNDSPLVLTAGLTLLAFFFASVLLLALAARPASLSSRLLTSLPLRTFGKYSYALYLFHLLLLPLYERFFGVDLLRKPLHSYTLAGLVFTLLATAASLVAAKLSWHLLESPCLALKRHFPYNAPPTTPLPSGATPEPV